MAADRVDFVDEDDTRRIALGLLEHVAHAARAHADKHFDEIGTRDGEEGDAGFTRDRAGEQRLAGARRADEQRALRNLAAELGKFARIFEEFDDFLKLFARLVDAGNIVEGHAALLLGEHLGAALAEAHRARSIILLDLAEDEEGDAEDQHEGQRLDQQIDPDIALVGRLAVIFDAIVVEQLEQFGIADDIGREVFAIGQLAGNAVVGEDDFLHGAFLNLLTEFRIGHRRTGAL